MQMSKIKETHILSRSMQGFQGKGVLYEYISYVYCWKEVSCNKLTEIDN
jgi:hypothetical protein